jgi:hypothetical protein
VRAGWEKLAWIALAIALIVVGCGPSATQSPPTPTLTPVPPTQTPTPTPVPPTQMPTPTPVPPTQTPTPTPVPPTQTPMPTATTALPFPIGGTFTKVGYTWEFKADGSYHSKSQWTDIDGVYTVTGNQIVIQEDYVPCKDIVGTYTWTYDGEALSFTVVDDQCRDRRNVVDRDHWLKKP